MFEAVIFDWAGTTMDYGCMAPAVVFVDVFKAKGIEDILSGIRKTVKDDHEALEKGMSIFEMLYIAKA